MSWARQERFALSMIFFHKQTHQAGKSKKINEIQCKSLKFNEKQWKIMKNCENQWNNVKLNEKHWRKWKKWRPIETNETQCKTMRIKAIQWKLLKSMSGIDFWRDGVCLERKSKTRRKREDDLGFWSCKILVQEINQFQSRLFKINKIKILNKKLFNFNVCHTIFEVRFKNLSWPNTFRSE